MSNEIPRVYRELIDEVIRSTEEDSYHMGIEKSVLEEIKNTWIYKICEYTDISEYKIRNGYVERYSSERYFEHAPPYPGQEYGGYREYSYPAYPFYREKPEREEKDEESAEYNQYDGIGVLEEEKKPEEKVVEEEELDSNELTESDCDVEADGGEIKNVMLCLFDKVTRVKDKRRCTLKHGFLSIGRTDYTFSIANGDLEW
jgi:transcription initiation factor TFIIA large subunit